MSRLGRSRPVRPIIADTGVNTTPQDSDLSVAVDLESLVVHVSDSDLSVAVEANAIGVSGFDLETAAEASTLGVSSSDLETATDTGTAPPATLSGSDLETATDTGTIGVSSSDLEAATDAGTTPPATLSDSDLETVIDVGSVVVSPISFVAATGGSTTTTSVAITMPAGAIQGDVLVAAVGAGTGVAPTFTWPVGWTVVDAASGNNTTQAMFARLEVAIKTFNTGDGTQTVTISTAASGGSSWACGAYRGPKDGASAADAFAQHGISAMQITPGTGWTTAIATPTVVDSTANLWRVSAFLNVGVNTATATGSYSPADTEREDNVTSSGTLRPDVTLVDSNGAITTNLVSNPGFEVDTAGWDTAAHFFTNSGATLTRITSDFDTGVASGQVVTDGLNNQEGTRFSITGLAANTTYTVSARAKVISGRPVRLAVRDTTNAINSATAYSSPASWTTFSTTLTTGATGNVTLDVYVVTDGTVAASTFLVDTVSVGPGNTSVSGTPSTTVYSAAGWIGLLLPGSTAKSSSDTATGTDAVGSVAPLGVEASVAVEASTIAATATGIDLETTVESGTVAVSSSDLETTVESGTVAVSSSDLETTVESGAVAILIGSDLETTVEASTIAATAASSDKETATDTGTVGVSSSDLSVAVEAASASVAISSSDLETAAEASTIAATAASSDKETAAESALVGVSGSDLETVAESVKISVSGSDLETALDTGVLTSVLVSDSDLETAHTTSAIAATLSDSDLEVTVATATVLDDTPPCRRAFILAENRTTSVPNETRVAVVQPENRETVVVC